MALFKKIFKKDKSSPRGFHTLTVKAVDKIGPNTVKVALDVPTELVNDFQFKPGQYINFAVTINGEQLRRSYSICSGEMEDLAVAVKQVENGKVSTWFNNELSAGDSILVSVPEGNFLIPDNAETIVLFAAGSGITPVLSMLKSINTYTQKVRLIYGNRTESSILFKSEIEEIPNLPVMHFLSDEENDSYEKGMIDAENLSNLIKSDLDILKSDAFMICGPEKMIVGIADTLKTFGVAESKVHYELFTTPTLLKKEEAPSTEKFKGKCHVTVILDDERVEFDLKSNEVVLDKAIDEGMDVPYSCKGGVCSACKAKIIEGKATMRLNHTLTDAEIAEGYIVTCQAEPASETLVVTYDH